MKLVGGLHGTSSWTVKGSTVTPTNALARRLAQGCH